MASTENTQTLTSSTQKLAKIEANPTQAGRLVKYDSEFVSFMSDVVYRSFAILAGPMRLTISVIRYMITYYILPAVLVLLIAISVGTLNVYLFYRVLYHPFRTIAIAQTNVSRLVHFVYTTLALTGSSMSVIPAIGPLWCSTLALGCNETWGNTANTANVSNNAIANLSVVTVSTIEEVEYANSLIHSIQKLSHYPETLNRNYVSAHFWLI